FVAVLLKNDAGEGTAANNQNFLVVLFQLFDESNKITVAAHDHERVDVVPGERHLQRVERKINVSAVLVTAGSEVTLNHLDRVLSHAAAVLPGALPVSIGNLRDDFAAFLDGFENRANIEVPVQCTFYADLDVVKIDEYGDL